MTDEERYIKFVRDLDAKSPHLRIYLWKRADTYFVEIPAIQELRELTMNYEGMPRQTEQSIYIFKEVWLRHQKTLDKKRHI